MRRRGRFKSRRSRRPMRKRFGAKRRSVRPLRVGYRW